MDKKLFGKNDLILLLSLLGILLFIALFLHMTKTEGKTVVVSVDGNREISFPLSEDIEYDIEGYEGGRNRLIIEKKKVRLTESSCPDHLCEKTGEIDSVGQSIICLPNRVVVEIVGSEESEFDAVAGE